MQREHTLNITIKFDDSRYSIFKQIECTSMLFKK